MAFHIIITSYFITLHFLFLDNYYLKLESSLSVSKYVTENSSAHHPIYLNLNPLLPLTTHTHTLTTHTQTHPHPPLTPLTHPSHTQPHTHTQIHAQTYLVALHCLPLHSIALFIFWMTFHNLITLHYITLFHVTFIYLLLCLTSLCLLPHYITLSHITWSHVTLHCPLLHKITLSHIKQH